MEDPIPLPPSRPSRIPSERFARYADQIPLPRTPESSMSYQKGAAPIDRAAIKKTSSAGISARGLQSLRLKSTQTSTQHQALPSDPWKEFWATELGTLILQFWDKWTLQNRNKVIWAGLIWVGLIFLIAKDHEITSQKSLTYLSDVLKVAGDFSETVDDGYLVERVSDEFRQPGTDLRNYYRNFIRDGNDDLLSRSMQNLIAELDGFEFTWDRFAMSRDRAIKSVKNQVISSRRVFQNEYEKLGGDGGYWSDWYKRQWKKILLDEPYESHFEPLSYLNITTDMDYYLSMWRKSTIPDLSFRLTSPQKGSAGGLPGKIEELWGRLPKTSKYYGKASIDGLQDARLRAISVLERADLIYEGIAFTLNWFEKGGGFNLKGGFAWWHLKELLGKFDEAVSKLEDADMMVLERQSSRPG
ncbi:hypothetical protein NHQ30_005813 [Ciborinia camelliae]|nr:hypothetical protein NHQ30_005813 [Ciborinia camelliae]